MEKSFSNENKDEKSSELIESEYIRFDDGPSDEDMSLDLQPKFIDLKWDPDSDITFSLHDSNEICSNDKDMILLSIESIFTQKNFETSTCLNFKRAVRFIEKKAGNLPLSITLLNHLNSEITGLSTYCFYPVEGDPNQLIRTRIPSNGWRDGEYWKVYRDKKPEKIHIDEKEFFQTYMEYNYSTANYLTKSTEENYKIFEKFKKKIEGFRDESKNFFYTTPGKEIIIPFLRYFTICCNDTLLSFSDCSDENFSELLYVIAFLHNSFIIVQPHRIGNGRMIRLICNILLVRCGRKPFWFKTLQDFMKYEYCISFCVRNRNKDFVKEFYSFLCTIYFIKNPIQKIPKKLPINWKELSLKFQNK